MKSIRTPNHDRAIAGIRRRVHRRRQAARRAAVHLKPSVAPRSGEERIRSNVADAFKRLAHGIGAAAAGERTKAFYRSSAQPWTGALAEQQTGAVKARVLEAFRTMLHGVQSASAHACLLRFYRSGGQAWTPQLG